MKNKYISFCLKAIVAGVLAFIILNIICFFYANPPSHTASETGSTDYVWEKNKFYSRGTEGFAWGITDENGFNNPKALGDGEIDVLLLGSSHLEGFNVAQNKNLTQRLNENFDQNSIDMKAYNIGVSGHTLPRCLYNAVNAAEEFKPTKYVVIETSTLRGKAEDLTAAVEGTLKPLESQESTVVKAAQSFPFLRRVYGQISNMGEAETDTKEVFDNDEMDTLVGNVSSRLKKKGLELIIVFNCTPSYDENGVITSTEDFQAAKDFEKICQSRGVTFVHMHEAYIDYYDKTYILPHGFSNSKAGSGHLNEYGHELVADELFETICRLEEK